MAEDYYAVALEMSRRVAAVEEILRQYEGWHVDSPEDSWRLERDLRSALGMPEAEYE